MRQVATLFFLVLFTQGLHAQLFSKERILNNENFDKARWSWGYYFGFNNYDFKFEYFEYQQGAEEIFVEKSTGFNVGMLGDLRLSEYLNLRLEPGLYYNKRNLVFPFTIDGENPERETNATYVHVPLLLKFSTKRLNNFKPFVVGGFSYAYNLASNQKNPDDNSAGQFRMTNNTFFYELGFGIDFYLPYFKFTPSIRGAFSLSDELVRDENPQSPFTGNIDTMRSRGVFINFTFQ